MTLRASIAALTLANALNACANLPPIASDVCGNGVVEPGEDCDTFAPDAASRCREPGSVAACHLDCAPRDDGPRGACPPNWGCQSDGICRPPTGEFEPVVSSGSGRGSWLLAADFDGDQRADALSLEPINDIGTTRMEFVYFNGSGQVSELRPFPKPLGSPVSRDVDGDGSADIAFAERGIGLLRGRADRGFIPDTFAAYRLPARAVRMFGVSEEVIDQASPIVALTTLDDVPGIYAPEASLQSLRRIGALPAPVEDLAGEPAVGDVFEDREASPCRELVYALARAREFRIVDLCTRDESGALLWREQVSETVVQLPAKLRIELAPRLLDVDLDGHLDVLLGAGGQSLVAYGDGASVGTPQYLELSALAEVEDVAPGAWPLPLAVGDVSGDGAPDFVFPSGLYVSYVGPDAKLRYDVSYVNTGAAWTQAVIQDFNRDARLDVVAASASGLNIDFFNGQGGRYLPASSLPSGAPVEYLISGDFDGDSIEDVAFAERPPSAGKPSSIRVAFGKSAGPPEAPVAIASVHGVEQLGVLRELGIASIVVASSDGSGDERSGALTLLAGSPDRLPLAPHRLTSIAQDGSIEESEAFSLAMGSFLLPDSHDVVALSASGPPLKWSLWVVPSVEQGRAAPARLEVPWDERLAPFRVVAESGRVDVAAASGDFDRDGLDDVAFAMPADEGAHCAVMTLRSINPPSARTDVLFLAQPCPRAAPVCADLNGDGAPDLALLLGELDAGQRHIEVLWNDGAGGFIAWRSSPATSFGELPQQFALLPSSLGRPLGLVYATPEGIWRVAPWPGSEQFTDPKRVGDILRGTGVAAADFNNDGVPDVAAIGAGDITLFRAALQEVR